MSLLTPWPVSCAPMCVILDTVAGATACTLLDLTCMPTPAAHARDLGLLPHQQEGIQAPVVQHNAHAGVGLYDVPALGFTWGGRGWEGGAGFRFRGGRGGGGGQGLEGRGVQGLGREGGRVDGGRSEAMEDWRMRFRERSGGGRGRGFRHQTMCSKNPKPGETLPTSQAPSPLITSRHVDMATQ